MELWDLKGEAPKVFWKMLKSRNEKHHLNFSNNQLSHYFSTLLSSEDDKTLNRDIALEEVKLMANKLKNGQASGLDMFSAELLKHVNDNFMLVFTKLFNKLLQSGQSPDEWSVGIIVALCKGGDEANLNNYRGITLLSMFGTFFLGVCLKD